MIGDTIFAIGIVDSPDWQCAAAASGMRATAACPRKKAATGVRWSASGGRHGTAPRLWAFDCLNGNGLVNERNQAEGRESLRLALPSRTAQRLERFEPAPMAKCWRNAFAVQHHRREHEFPVSGCNLVLLNTCRLDGGQRPAFDRRESRGRDQSSRAMATRRLAQRCEQPPIGNRREGARRSRVDWRNSP